MITAFLNICIFVFSVYWLKLERSSIDLRLLLLLLCSIIVGSIITVLIAGWKISIVLGSAIALIIPLSMSVGASLPKHIKYILGFILVSISLIQVSLFLITKAFSFYLFNQIAILADLYIFDVVDVIGPTHQYDTFVQIASYSSFMWLCILMLTFTIHRNLKRS